MVGWGVQPDLTCYIRWEPFTEIPVNSGHLLIGKSEKVWEKILHCPHYNTAITIP